MTATTEMSEVQGTDSNPWAGWQGVEHPGDQPTAADGHAPDRRDPADHPEDEPAAPPTAETTQAWDSGWRTPAGQDTHGWRWDSWSDSAWQWGTWQGSQDWSHRADPWSARDQGVPTGNWDTQGTQHDAGSQGIRDGDHSSNDGGSGHVGPPTSSSTRSGTSSGRRGGDDSRTPPTTRPGTTATPCGQGDESGGPCLTAWNEDGNQVKGGLSERMAVPTFNAEGSGDALGLSARSYLRQLDAWCKVTRAPASQRALLLYQSLGGRAWVEAEELNVDDLGTDAGVSILKAWIQERYQEVEVSKIAEALTQFFRKLRRQPSQTVREFNSAFDRAYARLIEIDCKLPEVAKAWVYLSALNLTNSEELSLLASVNNEYVVSKLQKAATLHEKSLQTPWRKWHHTPGGSGDRRSGPRGTYMTEIAEEGDEEYPDGETILPEEEAAELHEAFMAQEAAKNRYKEMRSRGYGNSQDNKDDAKTAAERLQQAKARSYCAGCKRRGHWHRDPECPLNAGKTPPQQTGSNESGGTRKGDGPKDAYVVHVAYEVGEWSTDGLFAITDSACNRTVAGEGWLQQYLEVSRRHGLKEQLLPCSEDFRFGASRLFHANYTATIYIEVKGKGFWTRAAIVSGEVPLLLSRSLLASLGMVFDLERHTACFRNLGAEETKLHYTSSGHPAIAVNPKPAASLEFPSLHQWGTREIIVIQPTSQQYTVFMTSAGSEPQVPRVNQGPRGDREVNRPILFPKKLSDVVTNLLTADVLNVHSFSSWWKQTKQSHDFWIETPQAFYRIHITPRRTFFYPDKWRTPYADQRGRLLVSLGNVRSTWAVACMNFYGLEAVHDMWEHGAHQSHDVLWIGRSVFARRPPYLPRSLDGNPPKEPMGHEQSRAYRPGDRGGDRLPLLVDNRRVTFAASGATTGHEDCKSSEGAIVDDPGRAAEQVRGTGALHTGEGDQRPADADNPRSDDATGSGDRDLRTLQEPQDVRSASGISRVEHSGDREQPECLQRAETHGGLREGEVREGVRAQGGGGGSGGERRDSLPRGGDEELKNVANYVVNGARNELKGLRESGAHSSWTKGDRQGLSEELGEKEPRGRTETSTDADRTSSRSDAGDQRVDDKVGGAQGQVQPKRRGTVNSGTSSTSTGPGKDSERRR